MFHGGCIEPGISTVSSWPCLYTKETPCRHTFCVTSKLAARRDSWLAGGWCAITNLPVGGLSLTLQRRLAYSLARCSNGNRKFRFTGIRSAWIEAVSAKYRGSVKGNAHEI